MVEVLLDRGSVCKNYRSLLFAQLIMPRGLCQERTFFRYDAEMVSASRKTPAKRSEARERLLATASELFYAEGINSVGVDRIVAASNVTLATFYRHFPSKQDLGVGYLRQIHDHLVGQA